jgi:hypothetical protein
MFATGAGAAPSWTLALALALGLAAGGACAADELAAGFDTPSADSGQQAGSGATSQSNWKFGVFGTIGAVRPDDHSSSPAPGPGRESRDFSGWNFNSDSVVGAQLDFQLDHRWSAVLQMVSEQGGDHSYRPMVEWANVKYQATPEFSIRAGRIGLPVFLSADFRKASYAYPWVRVPPEVYANVPVSSSDGVDLTYRWPGGSVKHVTQLFFGGSVIDVARSSQLRAHRIAGLSHTVDYGALTVRGSYMSSRLSVDFGGQGPAPADGPGGPPPLAPELPESRGTALGLGANYDPGNWFVLGELGRIRNHSFLGNKTMLYGSTGYRLGNFTPYIAYTQSRGSELAGPAAAAGLNDALSSRSIVQSTASAGLRWDFAANLALKGQFERVRPRGAGSGAAPDAAMGRFARRDATVFSAALSFVY